MAKICLKNMEMETYGDIARVGSKAPEFILTQADMMPVGLSDFANKALMINVFPSIDTKVCFASLQKCNALMEKKDNNLAIISVSMDLPYALLRSQIQNNLLHLNLLSDFRDHRFGVDYGVLISSGPLTGLLARSLFMIDEKGMVCYAEMSPELNTPCHYEKALQSLG